MHVSPRSHQKAVYAAENHRSTRCRPCRSEGCSHIWPFSHGHYRARFKGTYGTDVADTFIEGEHPCSKREVYKDGSIRCTDIFSKLVEVGEKLVVGKAQNKESYIPVFDDQKSMDVSIFATCDKNPKFTTDDGCKKIGSIEVPLAGSGTERSVEVRMIFGGTEITVECQETATGKITRLPINFLI